MKKVIIAVLSFTVVFAIITGVVSAAPNKKDVVKKEKTIEVKKEKKFKSKAEYKIEIEAKAKKMGITVKELKAIMKKDKEESFEEKAKSLGLTVEELKAKMVKDFETKAESLGITVEELKAKMAIDKKTQKVKKENYTFKNFKKYLKKDISKEDLKKAKELYEEAIKLKINGKDVTNVWTELKGMDIYKTEK